MSDDARGPALWRKAKTLIPGGGQLLSKRSERFLPGLWPAYYSKAKGCEVWSLEGRRYFDFAQMGVGSCVLGYADDDVNAAVGAAVRDGSMCTLNCFEEVNLAERLIEMHPWAGMARFCRTGGEACAIAVRIGRAASARGKVAFCGYHGWHDWYLAANLGDSTNLDEQLLPGLEPVGVPRELQGTALPFRFNEIEDLRRLVAEHGRELGVIIMEPQRAAAPSPGFLEEVRALATRVGAVLIFDEVTSGFRVNVGGIHATFGVEPDLVVYGKAMGNGFPISAVVGRSEVMEHAQNCFVSSTFWTERIGSVAALATLDKMTAHDVPTALVGHGRRIMQGWQSLAAKHGIEIEVSGIPPLAHLKFEAKAPLAAQTLYAQEMLKAGYLAGAAVYTTYAYTPQIIDGYLAASDRAFGKIKQAVERDDFESLLETEPIQAGFRRLT
jgi:glutamate-1-semialdehyde 2,1-aminomutase